MRGAWIAILLVVTTTTARAQSPDDDEKYQQAQEYFQSGKRAYDEKKYDVAIESFENAYRLTPKPSAAFALAMAYRNQWSDDHDSSKLKRAVVLFREVLAQPDDDKKPKWAKAKEMLDVLEPVLADLEAKQAAEGAGPIAETKVTEKTALILSSKVKGTMLRFDDEPEVAAPIVKETTPGLHRVAAYADGYYTTSQEVTALPGQSLPIDLVLDERPATLTVHSEDGARVVVDGLVAGRANQELSIPAGTHRIEVVAPGRHVWVQRLALARAESVEVDAPLTRTTKRRAVKWVIGGGGVLLVGSVLASWRALAAQSEIERIEDDRDQGVPLTSEDLTAHNDAIDRRHSWRTAAGWLAGGVGACALGVVYLLFTDTPPVLEQTSIAVIPGGATATYAWTF